MRSCIAGWDAKFFKILNEYFTTEIRIVMEHKYLIENRCLEMSKHRLTVITSSK